jgi:hypothetical protein
VDERSIRPGVWAAVLGSLAALGLVVFVLDARHASGPAPAASAPAQESPAAPAVSERTGERSSPFPGPGARRDAAEEDPVPYIEGELYGDLDLGEVRAALPDNLYWELGAPTKDPEVLEAREREKARRNEEYGRVLSGDASEEEVDAYYDYRERLSTDYLEFADYVNRRFADKLSEQFNGLLQLAMKLNKERLAQIPADREDALARSRERAKIREQWQREQAEFEAARRESAR